MMNIQEIQVAYFNTYEKSLNPHQSKQLRGDLINNIHEMAKYVIADMKLVITGKDIYGETPDSADIYEYENFPYMSNLVVAKASLEEFVDFMLDHVAGDKLKALTIFSTVLWLIEQITGDETTTEDKEYLLKQMEYITV